MRSRPTPWPRLLSRREARFPLAWRSQQHGQAGAHRLPERGFVREREIEINDKTTLQEMLSFIVTESGKMQAEDGCFDDCVMALAIAAHIHEGKWFPIKVTEEFYSHAI